MPRVTAQIALRYATSIRDIPIEMACHSFIVHAEVRLMGQSYSAFNGYMPSVQRWKPVPCNDKNWVVFDVDVDADKAHAFLEQACNTPVAYNSYPWQCILPGPTLPPDAEC